MLNIIKSSYFYKILFSYVDELQKLKLIIHNKDIKKKIDIGLINYKIFSGRYIIFDENNKNKRKIYNSLKDELIFEGEYLNGKKNGQVKENNGWLKFEGEYLNGKRNGKAKDNSYNEGLPILKMLIKNNKKIKTKKSQQNNYTEKIKNINSDISNNFDEKQNKENTSEKSSEENKQDETKIKIEQQDEFKFMIINKIAWCKYLNIEEEQFEILYSKILEIFNQKRTSIYLLTELIHNIGYTIHKNLENTKNISDGKVISEIWNINQFTGYYKDIIKRKNNITNYKNRYKNYIKKSIDEKWKNILYFMGISQELKYENLFDYFWYLWHLPKELIIIWLAKSELSKLDKKWNEKLINEWKKFIFEVLRSKGIKNWIISFVEDE